MQSYPPPKCVGLKIQIKVAENGVNWEKAHWVIISPYCFLGDGTEEQSDAIWADCCNQLDVLGRHRISHIFARVLYKGNQATSHSTKYKLNVLFSSTL